MSRSQSVQIRPNLGSTLEVPIVLRGTDGNPIDLLADPVLVTLIDLSPGLGTPTVVIDSPAIGQITITIAPDNTRVNGQAYTFRVRYYFEADDIVQTTPLFEIIYQ